MQEFNQEQLDLEILPNEAKKELMEFYQFLLFRYGKRINKVKELKKLFMKPKGKLPYNYKFNREEAHER